MRAAAIVAVAALAACAPIQHQETGTAATEMALQGSWSAVMLDGKTGSSRHLTLRFAGAKVAGTIACNSFEGGYRVSSGRIAFDNADLTALGCGSDTAADARLVEEILFPQTDARISSAGELILKSDGHWVKLTKTR